MPDDLAIRVARTANRLRLIQGQFAESAEGERMEYLRDELDHTLRNERNRDEFLERLEKCFPCKMPGSAPARPAPASRPASPPPVAQPAELEPQDLAAELISKWGSLTNVERESLSTQLKHAGIFPEPPPQTQTAAAPPPPPPKVEDDTNSEQNWTKTMRIKVDQSRAALLMALLIDEIGKMENCLTGVLEELVRYAGFATSVTDNREQAKELFSPLMLSKRMREFLVAEDEKGQRRVTERQVRDGLRRMRVLLALFVNAVNDVPERLYGQHLAVLEPGRIEPFITGWGKEAKCWERYREIANHILSSDNFRQYMLGSIADHIVDCARSQ